MPATTHHRFLTAGLFAGVVILAAPLPARALDRSLTEQDRRITDEAITRDVRLMDAWGARLAAVKPAARDSIAPYRVARAEELLRAAREEYLDNDRTGFVDAAFAQAVAMVEQLEAGNTKLPPALPGLAGSRALRPDLAQFVDDFRRSDSLACVADPLARLEAALAWAGNEDLTCGPCKVRPHLEAAERLAALVRERAEGCVPRALPPAPPPVKAPVVEAPRRDTLILEVPNVVHFALNESALGPESRHIIEGIAALLKAQPAISVRLEGHTDPRGSAAYNLALSKRRAETAMRYLLAQGVEASRVDFSFVGKSRPYRAGEGARSHALNRRVEFIYTVPNTMELKRTRQEGDIQEE